MSTKEGVLIAIMTWKRPDYLLELIGMVQRYTKTKYELVVSTASEDTEAIRICEEKGITCFHSPDRGAGRNRNQGMWYFYEHTQYDVLITLEDDCRLWEVGWEEEWIAAANRWGIVAYAYANKSDFKGGNRWDDPIWTTEFGFHASALNRGAMSMVGYSDPVYGGYGYDDTDLAYRYYRAMRQEGTWEGKPIKCHPCLNCHIGVMFDDSNFNNVTFEQNRRVFMESIKDPHKEIGVWYPWINQKDRTMFLDGIRSHIPKHSGSKPGSCLFCGGHGHEIGEKDGYPLRSCHGVTMSFPYKSEEEYQKIYTDGNYHSEFQENEGQPDYWDRDDDLLDASLSRMEILKAMGVKNGSTLLDIGAGTGALVEAATLAGFDALGIEPSMTVVNEAVERGRNVVPGSVDSVSGKYPSNKADVIYMSDVFEHLTNPRQALDKVWAALEDKGMLVIEMPEEGSPQSQQQGMEWRHYRPLQHVYLYTEGAARSLFEQKGFYVEAVTRPLRGSIGKIAYYMRKVTKTA